jgi:hypothetical protein
MGSASQREELGIAVAPELSADVLPLITKLEFLESPQNLTDVARALAAQKSQHRHPSHSTRA